MWSLSARNPNDVNYNAGRVRRHYYFCCICVDVVVVVCVLLQLCDFCVRAAELTHERVPNTLKSARERRQII